MATHLKHPKYYPGTYIDWTDTSSYYTCAGCEKKRRNYIGEMYIKRRFGFKGEGATIHKYCCSKKCYYFAWLKYMDDIDTKTKHNPQLLSEPEKYVKF